MNKKRRPPYSPYLVLIIAIILPGMGQVLNNTPFRGLLMLCFMLILGWLTYQLANENISIVGQFAGGLFIYAIMIMDSYYWAKYRSEVFKNSNM